MHLMEQYLIEERRTLIDQGLRVRVIGRRDRLPASVISEMNRTLELAANNTGTEIVLAIDYGGRDEITRAVREISQRVCRGELSVDDIVERTISDHLYTAGLPEVDLMIRTGGDLRVSNFLLWQLSYAEIWVTDKYWPEFEQQDFLGAIREFVSRQRRFGGLGDHG